MNRENTALGQWPEPTADQIEVLLLGTYHMDNPGLDAVNIEADDVLSPRRQRELSELTDRLEAWRPDTTAVERPHDRQDELDEIYELYRSDEVTYDEEVEIDPAHPARESPVSECRSEIVQIGVRLADQLGHERVHAIDYPMTMGDDFNAEERKQLDLDNSAMQARATAEVDVELPNPGDWKAEIEGHLTESTVTEHLRFLNCEANLRFNHDLLFAGPLAGAKERYVGARILSAWYERNLRILENLWRAADGETDRLLLLIGVGHVRVLRHLLSETPMFCPVSALSVLKDDTM